MLVFYQFFISAFERRKCLKNESSHFDCKKVSIDGTCKCLTTVDEKCSIVTVPKYKYY